MANRIANLLGNTKTRTVVLLVVGVLIFGVVVAVSQTGSSDTKSPTDRVSKTTEVPNQVASTPGEKVSRNYRELLDQANKRGAEEAAKKGTTFIPTLAGNVEGYDDKEFDKQLSSAYDDLGGKCSKETVAKLKKEGMSTSKIIMELKNYGCSAAAIGALFSADEIAAALLDAECGIETAAGCTTADAKALKDKGQSAEQITAAFKAKGCNLSQAAIALKEIGTNSSDIAKALKAAGASNTELAKAMKDSGASATEIAKVLKENGASTTEIAQALKDNGSSIEEIATALRANGASAADVAVALKAVGADATQIASALSQAGYSQAEILPALAKAGFSAVEIAKAMQSLEGGANAAALLAQQQANEEAARRLAAQQEAQQLTAYNQQRQAKLQELMTAMEAQKTQAMATWNEVPQQVLVQGEWAKDATGGAGAAAGTNGFNADGTPATEEPKEIIYKAGAILFAVLDTAVNSDEKGPVLATIVSGPLKGSRLMGTMSTQTDSETISLNFTAINMPNEKKSMGISAVAIDPDTARTALVSDVDHHYLMRWGSLFASSFVQGYASAVASAGTTQTVSQGAAGTTTNTTSPPLDGRQQLFEGIAAAATKWSEVVGKNFDRPITITIDQGTGIGVLLTADLEYGSDPVFYSATPTVTAAAAAPALPSNTTAAGAGLSTDQTAALITTLIKQQQGPTQVATGVTPK